MVPGVVAFYSLQTECLICKIFTLNLVNHHNLASELALNLKMDVNGAEVNLSIFKKLTSTELLWVLK